MAAVGLRSRVSAPRPHDQEPPCAHCLGSGSSSIVAYSGASFAAAVLNPNLLPHRSFEFMMTDGQHAQRRRGLRVDIDQQWNPRHRLDGTGACVWDAAVTLCDRLCDRPHLVEGRAVVELGSGCGLLAIVAALLGASCVHATDLQQALMLLARNAWLNEVAAGQARRRGGGGRCVGGGGVTVGCLNWGDASHAARVRDQCPDRRVDVILGSDLVYRQDRATFVALLDTVAKLSTPEHTTILFAGKWRMNPEDSNFAIVAKELGFSVDITTIPARQGVVGTYQLYSLSQLQRHPRKRQPHHRTDESLADDPKQQHCTCHCHCHGQRATTTTDRNRGAGSSNGCSCGCSMLEAQWSLPVATLSLVTPLMPDID
jgi:predicted nicotinamide N-methyase